jgi:hypothetical protein
LGGGALPIDEDREERDPIASAATVDAAVQPASAECTIPNPSALAPRVELSAAVMSRRLAWRSVSSRKRGARRIAAMPTGTLRKNP